MIRKVVVIGAGGLGREVAGLIADLGPAEGVELAGFAVSDRSYLAVSDAPPEQILGDLDWLRANRGAFSGLAIAIGTPEARLEIAEELSDFDSMWWPTLVSPYARLHRTSCRIGAGAIICAGVFATVNITIEPFAMINLGCTIGHDATIGAGSVISPGCSISGRVAIGRGVMVGTGARVLERVTIGDGAMIGAGVVVTQNVAADERLIGVPAVKRLRGEWKDQ